uniref:Hydrolytic enzymes of the alpha/beta hydrolase fold n=2 Tax=Kalmanozyma brasiliensis (strain GHG001) TaxID=1365824 RepID=V5F0R2_KALBG
MSQQEDTESANDLLDQAWTAVRSGLTSQQGLGSPLAKYVEYVAVDAISSSKKNKHNIKEPAYHRQALDHFDNTTQARFDQRFFYSTRHYKPASARKNGEAVPIYILDSGEADATARLPFLDTGILDILSKATGGIGIVLEHRYYGTSLPNRTEIGPGDAWGVDQLRWLTNKQALEDSADFIRHLTIPGTDNSEKRKIIYYGGSYPGARSAHMRLLYPDLVHGAIASSAVVAAVDEFPEYFYPIARGAPTNCSQAIQAAIAGIDEILAPNPLTGGNQPDRDANRTAQLLKLFGVEGLTNLGDLASLNTIPLGAFQSLNWDPAVTSTEFGKFCKVLTTYGADGKYSADSVSAQLKSEGFHVPREVHAYAHYMRKNYILPCTQGEDGQPGASADECFGTDFEAFASQTQLDANRAWTFQYCSTWGYIMTAPPAPQYIPSPDGKSKYFVSSGPKLVSTLLDYAYSHEICEKGFPAGEHYTMPARPDIDEVNKLGNFKLAVDRLAFIDGQYDPWRPATVHSEEFAYGGAREDTVTRPFKLIPDCWHHCDENGVKDEKKTPERVRLIHEQQVEFVKAWLKED